MAVEQSQFSQFAEVLVDCPAIDHTLTYGIPADTDITVGDMVAVPLQGRLVMAIVVHLTPTAHMAVKSIHSVVGWGWCSPAYWQVLRETADYYRTPLVQVIKGALPPQMLQSGQYRWRVVACPLGQLSPSADRAWQLLHHRADMSSRYLQQKLGKQYRSAMQELRSLGCIQSCVVSPKPPQGQYQNIVLLRQPSYPDLTERHKQIVQILQQHQGELPVPALLKLAKTTSATLKTMANLGIVSMERREILRLEGKGQPVAIDYPKSLTHEQQQAVSTILANLHRHHTFLLWGVTGSGKTEVYLQTIQAVLDRGKSALVLVPEIGLTPQLTDRFRSRFGDQRVLVYHSQLSDGERFDTWRRMLVAVPQVVIGTRSAVFAPLPHLGIIILDEEHDPSFKQEQPQPCYHARRVAQWRCELLGIPLILGSATPSSEALYSQQQQQLTTLSLPHRIGSPAMPPITVVDMRQELLDRNFSIFSRALHIAIQEMLDQKQQGILFIHRRGFHTFVSCRSCGFVVKCPHCDVSLTYHYNSAQAHLVCHYCGHRQPNPDRCPQCHSSAIKHFGSGSQRVEQELQQHFPHARLIRFDSDTTRRKDQHRQLIAQFRSGSADILVGTQMLTKGLDIPEVTLVGIVSADGLLNFSDYRASERACQTLLQVAGRCGRGARQGRVILQTYTPDHPAITAVANYEYGKFMAEELQQRQELNYPPYGKMVLIRLNSPNPDLVAHSAQDLAEYLRHNLGDKMQILGAQPAVIAYIADRWRWQILLKCHPHLSADIPTLQELRSIVSSSQVRLSVDIDPLQVI